MIDHPYDGPPWPSSELCAECREPRLEHPGPMASGPYPELFTFQQLRDMGEMIVYQRRQEEARPASGR